MASGGGEQATAATAAAAAKFDRRKHVGFYLRHLSMLPEPYTSADSQRMTLGFFALSALDLLGAVTEKLSEQDRREYADWIYEQQCPADHGGGFRGGPSIHAVVPELTGSQDVSQRYSHLGAGNLAMTYTALLSLAILRDSYERLDRRAIRHHVGSLQQKDGSFAPSLGHHEYDCRFVFCAFAVCALLDCWDAINVDDAVGFLMRSMSYDGSFGQAQGQEGQGGSTYCAVASLHLAGKLDVLQEAGEREALERWLLARQQSGSGFNGRPEKPVDTCYSFWCGAAAQVSVKKERSDLKRRMDTDMQAKLLGCHGWIEGWADIGWILSAQSPIGGISKVRGDAPDLMHSYLATAALAMHAHEQEQHRSETLPSDEQDKEKQLRSMLRESLQELNPAFNLSTTSLAWLQQHLTPN